MENEQQKELLTSQCTDDENEEEDLDENEDEDPDWAGDTVNDDEEEDEEDEADDVDDVDDPEWGPEKEDIKTDGNNKIPTIVWKSSNIQREKPSLTFSSIFILSLQISAKPNQASTSTKGEKISHASDKSPTKSANTSGKNEASGKRKSSESSTSPAKRAKH